VAAWGPYYGLKISYRLVADRMTTLGVIGDEVTAATGLRVEEFERELGRAPGLERRIGRKTARGQARGRGHDGPSPPPGLRG
jgi:hypothetical protein